MLLCHGRNENKINVMFLEVLILALAFKEMYKNYSYQSFPELLVADISEEMFHLC